MLRPQFVVLDLALSGLLGCSGVVGAWLLRRRSSLSIRNLYPIAVLAIAAVAIAIASGWWAGVLVLVPVCAPVRRGGRGRLAVADRGPRRR